MSRASTRAGRGPAGRSLAVAAAVAVSLAGWAGCGVPEATAEGCRPAPASMVDAVAPGVTDAGVLRHATLRDEGGRSFLSVELHRPDEDDDDAGDILTWEVVDADGAFLAVDHRARTSSSWPGADVRADADGVAESRGCTALER